MYPKTTKLLIQTLAAGALGFALRLALYRFGFDEKNILSATHPLQLACLGLTVFMAVYLALTVRKLGGSAHPAGNFPASPLRTLGILAAACFTLLHGLTLTRDMAAPLSLIRTVLAFAGAVSMTLSVLIPKEFGWLRTICRGVVCVFFALDMLCRYQSWSGNPQLPDYIFQVPACVLLSLLSYQRLAFDTGLGSRRRLLLPCLLGMFLCLLCAAGPETQVFYLGGACWAGGCMCAVVPPTERQAKEEPGDVPA